MGFTPLEGRFVSFLNSSGTPCSSVRFGGRTFTFSRTRWEPPTPVKVRFSFAMSRFYVFAHAMGTNVRGLSPAPALQGRLVGALRADGGSGVPGRGPADVAVPKS